jgi:integrase
MLLVMIGDDGVARRVDPSDLPRLTQALAAQAPAAVSVGELVERYLVFKTSLSRGPEERTLHDYRQYLRDHVWPHEFGSVPVAQATRTQARQWQNELLVKPKRRGGGVLGTNSVIKIRSGLVAPAFRWATLPGDDGQPPLRSTPSPFLGLELPEPTRFQAATLETTDQIHLFVDLAYHVDPHWADLVVAALCTGFRFGEITAVGPAALRPRTSEVAALRRFSGGRLLPGTKSGRGEFRTVPIPEPVMAMLTRRAAGKPADALLFTTVSGGRWPFSSYWKRWDRLRAKLRSHGIDLHLTGHGLRHSLISALYGSNTGDGLVRKIAGHQDPRMSDHYHHLTASGRAAITTITGTFLTRSADTEPQ